MDTVTRAKISPPLPKGKEPSEESIKKGIVHKFDRKAYKTACGKNVSKKDARWVPTSGNEKSVTCDRCKKQMKEGSKPAAKSAKVTAPRKASKPRVRKPKASAAPLLSSLLPEG